MREIKYTVSLDGVTPSNVQFGGMQGEHNATRLNVTIDTELFAKLEGAAYRFEAEDGAGCRQTIAMGEIESENVVCSVPQSVTCNGGNVTIRLIFSKVAETEIEYILYSFPIRLRFDLTSNGEFTESKDAADISAAVALAKGYTEKAEQAANNAENAAETAVNARNGIEQEIAESLTNAKESGEFDGKDGVSVTHEWNGTELTVTSASGTSSADLKGDKGDSYILTDDDKREIATEVNAVSYSEAQELTDEQKQMARDNIGAFDASLIKSSRLDVYASEKEILNVKGTEEVVTLMALTPWLPDDFPAMYKRWMREHLEVDGGKWEHICTIEGTDDENAPKEWFVSKFADDSPLKLTAVSAIIIQNKAQAENSYGYLYAYSGSTMLPFAVYSYFTKNAAPTTPGNQRAYGVVEQHRGQYRAYSVGMNNNNPDTLKYSAFKQGDYTTADYPYIDQVRILKQTGSLSAGNKIEVYGVRYYGAV